MSGFRINFELKTNLDEIAPFGEKGSYSLSWFGLTDSLLWITVGGKTIYEYSDAAMAEWGNVRYNYYYLSRFAEDLSDIFGKTALSVSSEQYSSVERFEEISRSLLETEVPDDPDDPLFEQKFDEYLEKTEWYTDRVFDSGHLTGGPHIGCFRCGDMLKLYWNGEFLLESGESIWTSPSGIYEMPYDEFVREVKRFFAEFFDEMDAQVKRALDKEWEDIAVDKEYLIRENAERKIGFGQKLALL